MKEIVACKHCKFCYWQGDALDCMKFASWDYASDEPGHWYVSKEDGCSFGEYHESYVKPYTEKYPKHYLGDGIIKCEDAMESMMSPVKGLGGGPLYWWLTAFKYIWRWPLKGGEKDINKCIDSLKKLKKSLRKNERMN